MAAREWLAKQPSPFPETGNNGLSFWKSAKNRGWKMRKARRNSRRMRLARVIFLAGEKFEVVPYYVWWKNCRLKNWSVTCRTFFNLLNRFWESLWKGYRVRRVFSFYIHKFLSKLSRDLESINLRFPNLYWNQICWELSHLIIPNGSKLFEQPV